MTASAPRRQIQIMRSVIRDVFYVLLGVLIPLASFTTGLQAPKPGRGEARLWRRPRQLTRDLLAVLILVPLWVIAVVLVLPLSPAIRAGLLISTLAVGIGPVSAMKRMGPTTPAAREALDLNLIVLVISLAFVPLAFAGLAALFRSDVHLGVGAVAKVVLGRALVPLLLGLGAARLWPRFAGSAGPVLLKILNVALLLLLVAALAVAGKQLAGVSRIGWFACAAASLGAIVIGHLMGGPEPGTRAVVAAASVMRFPALALALAAVTRQGPRLIPVILAYVLTSFVFLIVYGLVMSRRARKRAEVVPLHAVPRTT
jgi:BASS family bile acid:Na+ symporter